MTKIRSNNFLTILHTTGEEALLFMGQEGTPCHETYLVANSPKLNQIDVDYKQNIYKNWRPLRLATHNGLDDRNSIPGRGKNFSSTQHLDRLEGPPSLLSNRYEGSFPGKGRYGFEADDSTPSITKIKNGGAMLPLTEVHGCPYNRPWRPTGL
jgi:hypothetical protein